MDNVDEQLVQLRSPAAHIETNKHLWELTVAYRELAGAERQTGWWVGGWWKGPVAVLFAVSLLTKLAAVYLGALVRIARA